MGDQVTSILEAKRDRRIDVLRGLALIMIFVDHIPGNKLGFVTLHVFGFADAAELFVLFAGLASMLAYGKIFLRDGARTGLRRLGARCLRIYATHALLLMATLGIVRAWTKHYHEAPIADAPLLDAHWVGLARGLSLHALPGYLDILPLYIVLLAAFPLLFLGMRHSVAAALAASGAVWLLAQVYPALNLPNWLDPAGWYFDPFSWQLLFAIGAAFAVVMSARGGKLPKARWLTVVSWVYLGFACLQTFPFEAWGLPPLKPFDLPAPDKTHLSAWRILDVLALMHLVFSTDTTRRWARSRIAAPLEACGRYSLNIFALGCLLALFGRLIFRTFGRDWSLQIGVNTVGIVAMCAVALWLDARRRKAAPAPMPAWPSTASPTA